jgi:hypothetical protein
MIFFMARVLECALQTSLSSDIFFIMTAKIARRMLKLGPIDETAPWALQLRNTVNAAQLEMHNRWKAIERPSSDHHSLNALLVPIADSHSFLTMETLKDFITHVIENPHPNSESRTFIPFCDSRTRQVADSLPPLQPNGETSIWLADTEYVTCSEEGFVGHNAYLLFKNTGRG